MIESSITKNSQESSFPRNFLIAIIVICIAPMCLHILGVDFSSQVYGFHIKELAAWELPHNSLLDEMFYALTGGLQHGLLEWSAVIVAMLTIILAFAHYSTSKDVTMPMIGIALFCSGLMDAYHTMAAMRLIDAIADNVNLIPFTWALSRGFNAVILIAGVFICLGFNITNMRASLLRIGAIGILFGIVAYLLIHYTAVSEQLPQTQFPGAFITRPYDVLPLAIFIISIPVFVKLYNKSPNLLTASLVISLVPEIVLEAHMAFGSSALFDSHFNIAHFLKIVAYLVPFFGLIFDYVRTHRKQLEMQVLLEERELKLKQANAELEEFSYRTSHDLRSPLVSSIALLNMTEQFIKENDQNKALESLSHSQGLLKKLNSLIQNILLLSKAKNLEEESQDIDVSALINEALKKMEHMEGFSRLHIQKDLQLKNKLHTKESRFNMILENLISNAIKYQDPKKDDSYIKISTQNINNNFVLEVKDNGLGIPKDQRENLFTMFKRFHPKIAYGSGLGLYLMKNSADALNGEISFQDHDEGSIFRLSIPMQNKEHQ